MHIIMTTTLEKNKSTTKTTTKTNQNTHTKGRGNSSIRSHQASHQVVYTDGAQNSHSVSPLHCYGNSLSQVVGGQWLQSGMGDVATKVLHLITSFRAEYAESLYSNWNKAV